MWNLGLQDCRRAKVFKKVEWKANYCIAESHMPASCWQGTWYHAGQQNDVFMFFLCIFFHQSYVYFSLFIYYLVLVLLRCCRSVQFDFLDRMVLNGTAVILSLMHPMFALFRQYIIMPTMKILMLGSLESESVRNLPKLRLAFFLHLGYLSH